MDERRSPRPPIDPRGRDLPVTKLWLDGHLAPLADATLSVEASGQRWELTARLPEHDPFVRTYGVSLQLADGRALHGRVRMVTAGGGLVVFEGSEAPEGGWL